MADAIALAPTFEDVRARSAQDAHRNFLQAITWAFCESRWSPLSNIDPVRQTHDRMTGRQIGADIVQEYRDPNGTIGQWCFTEIEANSFHWISRVSGDEGATWRLTAEYYLKRRQPQERPAEAELGMRA